MHKIIPLMLLFASIGCGQRDDCSILKHGTFIYLDDVSDPSAFFMMRDGKHLEYHQEKKYLIESTVNWLGRCKYEMEMTRTNFDDFPFREGDKIVISITKVRGDTIYYHAEVNERSAWDSRVLKVGN
jgi:hypothetical protein